jgi:hypothetical protein
MARRPTLKVRIDQIFSVESCEPESICDEKRTDAMR